MHKMIFAAAAALTLSACGLAADEASREGAAAAAVDEKGLIDALNRSIDRKAVEGVARGAVEGAIREAIPPEVRVAGAVIDEKVLVEGVDQAIDGAALGAAVEGVIGGADAPAKN